MASAQSGIGMEEFAWVLACWHFPARDEKELNDLLFLFCVVWVGVTADYTKESMQAVDGVI